MLATRCGVDVYQILRPHDAAISRISCVCYFPSIAAATYILETVNLQVQVFAATYSVDLSLTHRSRPVSCPCRYVDAVLREFRISYRWTVGQIPTHLGACTITVHMGINRGDSKQEADPVVETSEMIFHVPSIIIIYK